ncbi:hypothetical protein [Leptolyngbya iicbica]|uniref:Uncharacterized protein n=2 Tax=Cyanophyceae TaxID=3028117 RepID=A0A4Q7EAI6_9CYAN|nr:hypothetical protein [Leptolyngbya sp. LK]RZM79543.1 hypothetical protein DYY88_12555 [Leptolyngbya sp. LK]
MPRKRKSANIPPYVLEKAQKAYARLLAAQQRLAEEPPEQPAKNISLELDPAILQPALGRAIEQLIAGEQPILKLEVNLSLIPDELLQCIEQCFQDKKGDLASSIYNRDAFKLGSWTSTKRSQSPSKQPIDDIQSQVADLLSQLNQPPTKDKKEPEQKEE